MTRFILSNVLVVTMITCSQALAAPAEKLDYFVFLVTGKSTEGRAQTEVEKMQAAHLENFWRLAKLGELSAAGPCADPDKLVRGIVVINATSIADAESKFAADPYVSEGYMKTEIHQFQNAAGKLVIPADTSKLEKSTIVIVSHGEQWPSDSSKQESVRHKLNEFAKGQFAKGKLGFAASFDEQSNNKAPRVAVMIFRGEDLEAVTQTIGDLDVLKDKSIRAQAFAQYLVKDAMPSN